MRLLSLICLARCAALPDIGVTYAATGRLNVLMAAESVRRLSTRYAHVHTLSADDHATCERLRGGAPWKCVDVTAGTSHAAQLWRHLAKYTAPDAPCRNSHSIAPTRLLKMVAIAAAPFRHNIFLDADTVPCFDLATLYTQLRAGGGMGLLDVYDLLLVPARESVPSGPAAAKGTWRAPAYDKSNSGVILWRKSRATMKLYHAWIHAYCSELCGNQIYGAVVLDRRVVLHAIDATPARWRGGAGSSPLDGAGTAASSPRNDLVKNCRVHPTHWLISTQQRALPELRRVVLEFHVGRAAAFRLLRGLESDPIGGSVEES